MGGSALRLHPSIASFDLQAFSDPSADGGALRTRFRSALPDRIAKHDFQALRLRTRAPKGHNSISKRSQPKRFSGSVAAIHRGRPHPPNGSTSKVRLQRQRRIPIHGLHTAPIQNHRPHTHKRQNVSPFCNDRHVQHTDRGRSGTVPPRTTPPRRAVSGISAKYFHEIIRIYLQRMIFYLSLLPQSGIKAP